MQIRFSKHATDQLKNRNLIRKSMVLETISNPDQVKASYRGRQIYQKSFGGKVLEVVVIQEDNILIIITEYFLDKL